MRFNSHNLKQFGIYESHRPERCQSLQTLPSGMDASFSSSSRSILAGWRGRLLCWASGRFKEAGGRFCSRSKPLSFRFRM
jgi:hypothetical protein